MIDIRHGDCLEILPSLDAASIAMVVTDPPYGINFVKKDTGREVAGRKTLRRNAGPIGGDNKPFDPTPFLRWPCVMFGANHFYDRLPKGGTFHAWDKKAYSTLDDSFSDVEFIWTSWTCKSRIISRLWKGVLRDSERASIKLHVSQKPLAVMMQLITWFTKPGDLILDPYAGSGTTLVAAMKTGRDAIGIEQEDKYIPIIQRRCREAETPLFAEAEAS